MFLLCGMIVGLITLGVEWIVYKYGVPYLKQKQLIHDLTQLKDVEIRRIKQKKMEMEKKLKEEIKRRNALKFLESRFKSKVMSDFYAGRF